MPAKQQDGCRYLTKIRPLVGFMAMHQALTTVERLSILQATKQEICPCTRKCRQGQIDILQAHTPLDITA